MKSSLRPFRTCAYLGRDLECLNSKTLTTEVRVPKVLGALSSTHDSNVSKSPKKLDLYFNVSSNHSQTKLQTNQQNGEIDKRVFFTEVGNNHCFFQLPGQTKRTGSCVLAHLIHITTVVSKDLACEPRTALLWAVQPPSFSLAYVAASTFHACEGTPASTRKYALLLRGAPS